MPKALLFCLFFLLVQAASSQHSTANHRVVWLQDYSKAITEAKRSGKPILVNFFAAKCVWCQKMDDAVYTSRQFVESIQNYIPLKIDIEDGETGRRIARNYRVESVPALLVIDSTGRMINRIGISVRAEKLIEDISRIQNLLAREKTNPGDWDAVQTLAEEYLLRDMNVEAENRFKRVLQAPVSDVDKESAQFLLALSQYYQQRNGDALKTLKQYFETYSSGGSNEDALLLLSQIHLEMDQMETAKQILKEFLQKYPASKSAGRAREVLTILPSK